jgi:protein-L-isoaspartate(D-aspartate) O-methyltransferase
MMNNSKLIDSLIGSGVLKTPRLIEAFLSVDRIDFVPRELSSMAYADIPLPIGAGQTISQPYTVAFMLELLQPKPADRVLDVGSGSGWTTALLATTSKSVDAVERVEALVEFSKENLAKYAFENVSVHRAKKNLGLKGKHFDKILVSCAADELPKQLLDQLSVGGVMVIPVLNSIVKVTKNSDRDVQIQEYPGFVFVPLIRDDA